MFVYDGKIYTRLCVPVVTCPALDLPTAHATGTLLASSSAFSLAETANKEFASAASVMEKPVVFPNPAKSILQPNHSVAYPTGNSWPQFEK